MSVSNPNRLLYKHLKKRSSANRQFKASVKSNVMELSKNLIPRYEAPKDKKDNSSNKVLSNLQKDYDKKIKDLSKDYQKELALSKVSNNDKIKGLQEKLSANDKRYKKVFDDIGKRLNNKSTSETASNVKPGTATEQNNDTTSEQNSSTNNRDSVDYIELAKKIRANNLIKASEIEKVEKGNKEESDIIEIVFNNVGLSSKLPPESAGKAIYDFGEFQMKLTDPFGIRDWEPRKDEHSNGIDVRLYKNGSPVDYPVALANGKIVKIGLEGDGSIERPTKEKAGVGGVFAYIQLDENPNKIYKMVHLPMSFYNSKEKYLNKKVTRGDVLIEESKGTGSMSGPHIKYAIADYNPETGESSMNYSDDSNNPTNLFFTGKLN